MLPELDYVDSQIGDQLPLIRECILAAWDKLAEVDPSHRRSWTTTTRANVVQNWIVEEASRRLSYLQICDCNGMKVFVLRGGIALRFKKLDRDCMSHNVRTGQVSRFRMQEALDGVPSLCNLEAGYVLNPLGTEVESTHLVCPNGRRNIYWAVDLRGSAASAEIVDLFKPTKAPDTNVVQFKPKRDDQGDENAVDA